MNTIQNEKRNGMQSERQSERISREIPEHMSPELNKALIDFIQTEKFSDVREHIYCYPLEFLGADAAQKRVIYNLQKTCPSFYLYGFLWFPIIDLSEIFPVNFWDYISFDMIIRWLDLSEDQIMDVALENIGKKLSSVKLSLLYDSTNPRTAVAVYELSMQDMSAFPEYGCSLILSDHYLNIIAKRWEIISFSRSKRMRFI